MTQLTDILVRIALKKQQYDSLKPFPERMMDSFRAASRIELTYHSNAIEGNTLTLAETALVVNEHQNIPGKTLREIHEAENHAKATDTVDDMLQNGVTLLTEGDILTLHKIILTNIDDDYAGRYRDVPVRISGSTVVLPNSVKVPELMQEFATSLAVPIENDILFAAQKKYDFLIIHPFIDCNGRMSRLIWNFLLQRAGYPPVYLDIADRPLYMNALADMNKGNTEPYYILLAKSVERSLTMYLQLNQ
jgi:Fic family protein